MSNYDALSNDIIFTDEQINSLIDINYTHNCDILNLSEIEDSSDNDSLIQSEIENSSDNSSDISSELNYSNINEIDNSSDSDSSTTINDSINPFYLNYSPSFINARNIDMNDTNIPYIRVLNHLLSHNNLLNINGEDSEEYDDSDSDDDEYNNIIEDINDETSIRIISSVELYNAITNNINNEETNIDPENMSNYSFYRDIFKKFFNKKSNIEIKILNNVIKTNNDDDECNVCMDITNKKQLYKCNHCTFVTHYICNEKAILSMKSNEIKCIQCNHVYD